LWGPLFGEFLPREGAFPLVKNPRRERDKETLREKRGFNGKPLTVKIPGRKPPGWKRG